MLSVYSQRYEVVGLNWLAASLKYLLMTVGSHAPTPNHTLKGSITADEMGLQSRYSRNR